MSIHNWCFVFEKILDSLQDESPNLPNTFTIALGDRIRVARLEAGLSQADLSSKAYFRQSSISKIESGLRAVSYEEILYLSYALDKPILYFFPEELQEKINTEDLTILEQELLSQARRLHLDDLHKLIAQARAIADFNEIKRKEQKGK